MKIGGAKHSLLSYKSFVKIFATRLLVLIALTSCSTPIANQSQKPNTTSVPESPQDRLQTPAKRMGTFPGMDLGEAGVGYDARFLNIMHMLLHDQLPFYSLAAQKSQSLRLQKLAATNVRSQGNQVKQLEQFWKEEFPEQGNLMAETELNKKQTAYLVRRYSRYESSEFDANIMDSLIQRNENLISLANDGLRKIRYKPLKDIASDISSMKSAENRLIERWRNGVNAESVN